jgi:murein DD-endopeptidase MepM/ murein hydrolase activator NlpD
MIIAMHSLLQEVILPVALAEAAAQVVPAWARGAFYAWILSSVESDFSGGVVIETSGSGSTIIDVGTLTYDGYIADTASFVCTALVPGGAIYITDNFGSYRSETYAHSGIDYGTNHEQGLEVITPMGGKVVYVGIYGGWGYSVLIENNGYQVLLSHASEVLVEVGQEVNAGDVVMLSGGCMSLEWQDGKAFCVDERDGISSGAHLHFEVRLCTPGTNGAASCVAVDPGSVTLPGQSQTCDWTSQVSDPDGNSSK